MAALLLSLTAAFALLGLAHGDGTVVELHKDNYFEGPEQWIVPDPTAGSPESAPLGCTNLPAGFEFTSGRVYWNTTAGKSVCQYIWFFFEPNCQGAARGIEAPPKPEDPAVPWATQDAIYSRTTYNKVMEGLSVGCSFEPDPCKSFPCADPNAACSSSSGWSWKDGSGKEWASQIRNCSACKPGFSLVNGTCQSPSALCASLACKSPGKCETDPEKGAYCTCPPNYTLDPETQECKAEGDKLWLAELNTVRKSAAPATPKGVHKKSAVEDLPLVWSEELAAIAANWTRFLNSTQCGKDNVVLTKIPDSNCSESDVWVSWSSDENSAVQLWAPLPSDISNPRTARITDQNSRFTGCGKTVCGTGAFFTCLFWPKTF